MGNSVQDQGGSLLSNMHFPYHLQLGRHAAIDVTKTEAEEELVAGRVDVMKWNVSYTINESRCEVDLKGYLGKDRKVHAALFTLGGDIPSIRSYHLKISKAETDLLEVRRFYFWESLNPVNHMAPIKINRTIHTWGGFTETTAEVYGSGNKGGLVVWEQKKKSRDEKPYMVTVAHYYATSKGDFFDQIQNRLDIGLSVAVKVTASNDMGLNFRVEGPTQHPAAALFYMFDEVRRTGIWKPTACPHCANIQRQSESEDSDNFPPAQRPRGSTRPNAGSSVIVNDAPVKGNYNGSFFVKRLFLR